MLLYQHAKCRFKIFKKIPQVVQYVLLLNSDKHFDFYEWGRFFDKIIRTGLHNKKYPYKITQKKVRTLLKQRKREKER